MSFFIAALVVHVLAAVLGVGPVAFMAIVGSRPAITLESAIERREVLVALSRWVSIACALMLLSGLVLGASGLHEMAWYRASVLLLVAVGALNGVVRRKLRKTEAAATAQSLRFVARASWAMCAIVGAITVLMTLRPG
jgi:hypothetical protein